MARLLEQIHGAARAFSAGAVHSGVDPALSGAADFRARQQGKLHIHCEPFADPLTLPRAERQAALQHAIDRYAKRLEHYALQSPLDWFNFSISGSCRMPKRRSKGC